MRIPELADVSGVQGCGGKREGGCKGGGGACLQMWHTFRSCHASSGSAMLNRTDDVQVFVLLGDD